RAPPSRSPPWAAASSGRPPEADRGCLGPGAPLNRWLKRTGKRFINEAPSERRGRASRKTGRRPWPLGACCPSGRAGARRAGEPAGRVREWPVADIFQEVEEDLRR